MQFPALRLAFPFALSCLASVAGCSSSTSAGPSGPPSDPTATVSPTENDGGSPDAGPTCAPPPKKSFCEIEGAWVRGTAHFDPAKLQPGSKPILRVSLRHAFALIKGEETIGGRLHGYLSIPITDRTKGEQPFAIDMCDMGVAMWSEENGTFNLVLHIDEDDNNDLDKAMSNEQAIAIGTPSKGELVKMVNVDVSCNAPSACLDVTVDCTGPECLAIKPITSCKKKTPACNSDDSFCK